MKLTSYWLDELNRGQLNRIMDSLRENGSIARYLNGEYSHTIVNAKVVVDEDFNLCDIKVFDPYNLIKNGKGDPVYISWNGWSNWLLEYRDNVGHDVDEILNDYDGMPQGIMKTAKTYFRILVDVSPAEDFQTLDAALRAFRGIEYASDRNKHLVSGHWQGKGEWVNFVIDSVIL